MFYCSGKENKEEWFSKKDTAEKEAAEKPETD